MPRTKAFVSYDHSEDAHYKWLLMAWDANSYFDFDFDSRGPNVAIDSNDAAVVKSSLTKKLMSATHLLVIVGSKSSKSKWISWEITRAKQNDIRLKIAAVKLDQSNISPPELLSSGTSWATSFERDRIVAPLRNATNSY
jgi:hypothetical protein